MKLQVEEVDYEDKPLAPEMVLLHRSQVTNNFVGRELSTEYLLRVGEGFLRVVGKHDKKSKTTSLICGKRK